MVRTTCLFPLRLLLMMICAAATANLAWAGGGPENVLLMVNSNSLSSKTIANHYQALRNIPASNIVYVDWRGGLEGCQGPQFAEKILRPAIEAIRDRGLSAQIDYVVYSSDFPWRVDLRSLFPDHKFDIATRHVASCNGATYLWQYIRDKNPALMLPVVNWYRVPAGNKNYGRCQDVSRVDSRGFCATYFWTADGTKTRDPLQGQSYLLSTMLGVTTGRGNTVDEVLDYLKRSAAADGALPRGTFYFMKSNDIRSITRHDCYDAVAGQLAQLGQPAQVLPGTLPQGRGDVLGIMTGTSTLDFVKSGSKLLPGAICDHLTSLGGDLSIRAGQTPLTEFLRYGAAGASGTVIEPLALQSKFPLPSMFLHYARGCSLAESFYQSVAGPYQLLIVGDPLCQPFAVAPKIAVDGIKPGQEVRGTLTIQPTATAAPTERVGSLELFVDGRLVVRFKPGRTPQMDTTELADGYHELRVVAVNADAIETRGRSIVPIMVNNHGVMLELAVSPHANVAATDKVRITARQPGATAIIVRQNRREVARIDGESGETEVLAATFGRGPAVFQAESEGPQPALSRPVTLDVH